MLHESTRGKGPDARRLHAPVLIRGGPEMANSDKTTPMTPSAAARIQSNADKSGQNQSFKARAQAAAAKNSDGGKGTGGGKK